MKLYQTDTFDVVWVSRSEWGASAATEAWIAARQSHPPASKTEAHIHHTAAIDTDDTTPNQWDLPEVKAYMRRLQIIRPDLGPLPYSENLALSEDLTVVWLLEGRGLTKQGAHTGGHNVPGIGFSWLGNFQKQTSDAALAIAAETLTLRLYDLRHHQGFTHLGDELSPNDWEVWGHRDSKSTACPGAYLYPYLAGVRFIAPKETQEPFAMLPIIYGDGIPTGSRSERRSDVGWLQAMLNEAGAVPAVKKDGYYGDATKAAVLGVLGAAWPAADGTKVDGGMWHTLMKLTYDP